MNAPAPNSPGPSISFIIYKLSTVNSIELNCLTAALERLVDLSIFLIQTLSTLLRKRVLESIRSVMSSKNIDRSVKSRERRLSSNLGETTVIGDKVDHFLLHILSIVFHLGSSLSESGSDNHVISDLLGVLIVVESETPVFGEGEFSYWDGNLDLGGGNEGKGHSGCSSKSSGSYNLEEVTTGANSVLL